MPAFSPPPGGLLSDVPGLRVGHADDPRRPTGCTVVLCGPGAVAGVDVRGAAPGTRETELLSPINAVQQVHAVLLSGGSAFGLDAAGGVMAWLAERGVGLKVGPACVPIVPAAILFDLWLGDPGVHPDAEAGRRACDDAVARAEAAAQGPGASAHPTSARTGPTPVNEGNLGAGCGASVGKWFGPDHAMRGGLGQASLSVQGLTVAALAVVNAMGDVLDPRDGRLLAGARHADRPGLRDTVASLLSGDAAPAAPVGGATTLVVIGTDARLDKAQASLLARMAHDGLARSIRPVHSPSDGDTVFALATGAQATPIDASTLGLLGTMAAEACARAVVRGVWAARPLGAADAAAAGPGGAMAPIQAPNALGAWPHPAPAWPGSGLPHLPAANPDAR